MISEHQLAELAYSLDQLGIVMFSKRHNDQFISCNEKFASFADIDAPCQILGKKDCELGWREQAEFLTQEDAYVRGGGQVESIYRKLIKTDSFVELVENKVQLVDQDGYCIGVVGIALDITGRPLNDHCLMGRYDNKTGKFFLGSRFNNQWLTRGEYNIFQHVILGKTTKEIAAVFNYSARTVEDYIERLKIKLECTHKHQLIQCALTYGFFR